MKLSLVLVTVMIFGLVVFIFNAFMVDMASSDHYNVALNDNVTAYDKIDVFINESTKMEEKLSGGDVSILDPGSFIGGGFSIMRMILSMFGYTKSILDSVAILFGLDPAFTNVLYAIIFITVVFTIAAWTFNRVNE